MTSLHLICIGAAVTILGALLLIINFVKIIKGHGLPEQGKIYKHLTYGFITFVGCAVTLFGAIWFLIDKYKG